MEKYLLCKRYSSNKEMKCIEEIPGLANPSISLQCANQPPDNNCAINDPAKF